MYPTFSRRLVWSALAAAVAPYAMYLLAARQVKPTPIRLDLSEDDLLADLFDGEVAASTL